MTNGGGLDESHGEEGGTGVGHDAYENGGDEPQTGQKKNDAEDV
jgi:hypothetical protein